MTRRLLVVLVLRVVGILLLVRILFSLAQGILMLRYMGEANAAQPGQGVGSEILAILVYSLLVGSFGLICLTHTSWIASRLFPEFGDQEVAISGKGLGVLAFRVLGGAWIVYGAPGLVTSLLEIFWGLGKERRPEFGALLGEKWATDFYWLASVIVGVLVFANAHRLAGRQE